MQADGKIIVGGQFTTFNGTTQSRIARLNSDGSLDASFTTGSGANGYLLSTALQSDGNIMIGGSYTSFNGTARNRIARLFGEAITSVPESVSGKFSMYPNPTTGNITLNYSEVVAGHPIQLRIFNLLGQCILMQNLDGLNPATVNLQPFSAGSYIVELQTGSKSQKQQLLLQQ